MAAAAGAEATTSALGVFWALTESQTASPISVSFTALTSVAASSLPAVGLGPNGLVTTVPYLGGDATPTTKGPGAGRMTILTEAATIYSAAPTLPGFTALSNAQQSTSHGTKTSTGGLVAAVLIPIAFAGILAGGFAFWWIRRRKRMQMKASGRDSSAAAAERGRGRGHGRGEAERPRAGADTGAASRTAPVSEKKGSSDKSRKGVMPPMREAPRLSDERATRHARDQTAADSDSRTDVEDEPEAARSGSHHKAGSERPGWSRWKGWKLKTEGDDPFGDVVTADDKSPTESSSGSSEKPDEAAGGARHLRRGSKRDGNG